MEGFIAAQGVSLWLYREGSEWREALITRQYGSDGSDGGDAQLITASPSDTVFCCFPDSW